MAADSWLKYTPSSGSGSSTINYSTDFHYGRKKRSTTSSITSTVGGVTKNVTARQYGCGPYWMINNVNPTSSNTITVSASRTQTSASFNFDINFYKIELTQVDTETYLLPVTIPQTGTWTGVVSGSGSWTLNNNITNDPGASQRYKTTINISFTANSGSSRSARIRFRGWYKTAEHDVNQSTDGSDAYNECYLVINQAGLSEYSVYISGITPDDPSMGDNTTWHFNYNQSDAAPVTTINATYTIQRNDGQFDNGRLNNITINSDGQGSGTIPVYDNNGSVYRKNPDLISGSITGTASGTSQTAGWVCTSVSLS